MDDNQRIGVLNNKQKKWLLISIIGVVVLTAVIIVGAVMTAAGNKELYKIAEDKAYEIATESIELDADQVNFSKRSETRLLFGEDDKATVSGWVEGHETGDNLNLKYDYEVYMEKADSGDWEVYDYMLALSDIGG